METLCDESKLGQVAKAYQVHPNSIGRWKKMFLARGPEICARDSRVAQYERHLAELEQLLGKQAVEMALLKNCWRQRS